MTHHNSEGDAPCHGVNDATNKDDDAQNLVHCSMAPNAVFVCVCIAAWQASVAFRERSRHPALLFSAQAKIISSL